MWHVRQTGEVRTEFWWGNLKGPQHLEGLGVDRIILKWILKNLDRILNWIAVDQNGDRWRGASESGNEISGSIKCRNFLNTCGHVSFLAMTMLRGVSYLVKTLQLHYKWANKIVNVREYKWKFTKFGLGKCPIIFQVYFRQRPQCLLWNTRWQDSSVALCGFHNWT